MLAVRIVIALLLVAPLGFVLGMPFPLGLQMATRQSSALAAVVKGAGSSAKLAAEKQYAKDIGKAQIQRATDLGNANIQYATMTGQAAVGYADGMVTGVTRNFGQALEEVMQAIDPAPGGRVMGMSIVLSKGRTLFIADTNVTEMPEAEELVEIACEAARAVGLLGFKPRVAFMSYSTFGNPMGDRSEKLRDAVAMLDEMDIDFEYEGEMPPELALEPDRRGNFPFMRLNGPANVLIMPAIHSASISTKLVQSIGGGTVIGPILLGMGKSVQICPLSASVSTILNMAMLAAYNLQADATP